MIASALIGRLEGVKHAIQRGANVNAQDEVCKCVTI